jgi:hypothetical protein
MLIAAIKKIIGPDGKSLALCDRSNHKQQPQRTKPQEPTARTNRNEALQSGRIGPGES